MKKFFEWLEQRTLQEGLGDVRQVKIINLTKDQDGDPVINFELIQGGQPTGQKGVSSPLKDVKVISNNGEKTLIQLTTASGTAYMAMVNKPVVSTLQQVISTHRSTSVPLNDPDVHAGNAYARSMEKIAARAKIHAAQPPKPVVPRNAPILRLPDQQ